MSAESNINLSSDPLLERRLKLQKDNRSHHPSPDALDGSIKKNSAFVKKLKTLNAEQLPQLLKELQSLKLEKYLSEITMAIAESKLKNTQDAMAAAEICSALHQRFPGFANDLIEALFKNIGAPPVYPTSVSLDQKEKEEGSRISKLKSILRLIVELFLVGLTHPKYQTDTISGLVHGLLHADKDYLNSHLAMTFVKTYSLFFLPKDKNTLWATEKSQETIRTMLTKYYKSISSRLLKEQQRLNDMDLSNQEYSIAKGSLSEERKERTERASKTVEKLHTVTLALSQALELDMPELPKPEEIVKTQISIVESGSRPVEGESTYDDLWEDEETKAFYEDIIDLKNLVPAVCLESSTPAHTLKVEETAVNEDATSNLVDEESPTIEDFEDDSESPVALPQFESIQARLIGTLNRDSIDQIAVDFALINAKGTRKRLIKLMLLQARSRADLIPYFGRMLASLNPYISEVAASVIQSLESSFHKYQKGFRVSMDEKLLNVRFMAELCKFKVAPIHMSFHYIKCLLDDFSPVNIDLLCVFLESCGRFLYLSPESSVRMTTYLDTLMRKKNALTVDSRLALMIDNAYFQCKPPEKLKVVEKKERTPLDLFVRKLLYHELARGTVDDILRTLRKLNWQDPTVFSMMVKRFSKVWKLKFSHLDLCAFMVAELNRFHSAFGTAVVDNLFESIVVGLEKNLFKENQQRIAQVKFLSELYNFKMIEHTVIFDALYLILTFGYDTCGSYFKQGNAAKKLDKFLIFFQMFIFTKVAPPVDIEFMILDTFEKLRPKMKLLSNYEEAILRMNSLIATEPANPIEDPEEESDKEARLPSQESEDEDFEEESSEGSDDSASNDSEEDMVAPLSDEEMEQDDDFDKEFSKMMLESMGTRRIEKKAPTFDMALPLRIKQSQPSDDQASHTTFTLLTKKGHKQQSKQIELPSDSGLVMNAKSSKAADLKEKEELKRIVLHYEEQERRELNGTQSSTTVPSVVSPVLRDRGHGDRYRRSSQSSRYSR